MNLYNNKITRRTNKFLRDKVVAVSKRKQLVNNDFSLLCNNCTGGFILHDLGLRFNTPTINMYFHEFDFFDFVENLDYYLEKPLVECENPQYDKNAVDYPVAVLQGDDNHRDLELHFMHYPNFKVANEKWEDRKSRINKDNLFVIWTFKGLGIDEELYKRAQNLPVKNKVIFVNHPVNRDEYPSFYYIKGFENQVGLGLISDYCDLSGHRYYDQFDYVSWFNNGK